MPRLPIDYSRTVIYRISCNDLPEFIYVGSTTDFTNRKRQHKQDSKTKEIKLYQTIRENGGWDNWRMTIIEEYSDCKNNIEQRIREQKWIDELNGNLNMVKAYITKEERKEYQKEYQEQNREEILQKSKEYREQNKDQISERMKQYYEQTKEEKIQKSKEYQEQNREKIVKQKKEQYEQNKEEILQKMKEYREQNKEKLSQKAKERYRQNKERNCTK